jgi:hypothetical protein
MHYLRKFPEPQATPTHLVRRLCLRSLQRQPLRSPGTVPQHLYSTGGTTLLVSRNRLWSPPLQLQDSSSLRRPVSAGLGETSQRPFSEVSIPYLVEPLSPDPRSPALVATSPIDVAYPIQPSVLSALKVDEKPKTPPEHGVLASRSHLAFNRQAL